MCSLRSGAVTVALLIVQIDIFRFDSSNYVSSLLSFLQLLILYLKTVLVSGTACTVDHYLPSCCVNEKVLTSFS
jgi:hypothetical protein